MSINLVVTALPWKDYRNNKPMLSAFFSIQVDTPVEKKLDAFPDIMQWVDKVSKAKFIIQWNNSTQTNGKPLLTKLDKKLYEGLFTNKIKIRSYTPEDLTAYPIRSYPAKYIVDFVHSSYNKVGNVSSDFMPNEKFFTDEWKDLLEISEYKVNERPVQDNPTIMRQQPTEASFITLDQTYRNRLKSMLKSSKVVPFGSSRQPAFDFAQLRNFHESNNDTINKPPVIDPPNFEYHDILSVLTSYPQLMRKFGLVVDLEMDATVIPVSGVVRIIPQGMDFSEPTKVSSPATAYIKTANGFFAQSQPGSMIEKGLLKLNNGEFTAVQVDADGAALKLCNQIDNMQQKKARHLFYLASAGLPGTVKDQYEYENQVSRDEGLPALRSSGIGIAKNGLASGVYKKLQRSNTLKPSLIITPAPVAAFKGLNASFVLPAETLYADDLAQGYRMDIAYEEKPDDWKSLHWRQDEYFLKPEAGIDTKVAGIAPDEGFIQLAMSQEDTGTKSLTLGEVLARWEGWSLSVLKPGKGLNNPEPGGTEVNNDSKEKEKYILPKYLDFRLQANSYLLKDKGTLPRLRFGQIYRIKIRTVDLAGNSLPYNEKPENETISVLGGIQYRRYEPTPTPALVLGNEVKDGESMEQMVIRSNYDKTATQYESDNPTPVSGGGTKKFPDSSTRFIKAPRTSQHMAEVHGMFDEAFGSGNSVKAKAMYDFIVSRDKETINPADYSTLTNFIYNGEVKDLKLEWLADPMAAGIVFSINRQSEDIGAWAKVQPRFFSFYFDPEFISFDINQSYDVSKWMAPKALAIRLVEANISGYEWKQDERILYIRLPKGHRVTLNYASFWRPDDIKNKSALYNILFNGAGANPKAREHSMNGQHWMFSPWRQLALTHAVQQPLAEPDLKTIDPERKYDSTTASLSSLIRVSGISTDKINLQASWKEFTDDLAEIGPDIKDASAHVAALNVEYNNSTLVYGQPKIGGVPYTFLNDPSEHKEENIIHQFGDTKHRNVEYQPIATTRYREYFTTLRNAAIESGKDFPLTRDGNKLKVNIPSTARPVAPLLEYVIPSFNWLKNATGKMETHIRTGNVRVYMKRPWFSSGEGEQIAVVLARNNNFTPELAKYCTIWGKDPLFYGGELNSSNFPTPDQATFPFAANYEVSLAINEANGIRVAAAAYNVLYDQERQLYYADIPIGINQAYFPFVKLALARYQKDSLRLYERDCCLSNIVHADWLQIVPMRNTTLLHSDIMNQNKVTVGISGPSSFVGISNPMLALKDEIRTRIRIIVEDARIPKDEEVFVRMQGDRFTTPVIWQRDFDLTSENINFSNHQFQFSTNIELGDDYTSKPYRVVIEEYELHLTDPLRQPSGEGTFATKPEKWQERLVFMDVFEVNGSV